MAKVKTATAKQRLSARSERQQTEMVKVIGDTEVYKVLECGPMPIVMVTLPNIGGALCSLPQSLADAHY